MIDATIPLIDLLTLFATALIAVFTFVIARRANQIAARAVDVEADKMLLEWAQDTLDALARATALRLRDDRAVDHASFHAERRELRTRLVAAHHTGRLFLAGPDGKDHTALEVLQQAASFLDGRSFRAPKPDDFEATRRPQVTELTGITRSFTAAVQQSVGDAWVQK
ncbi:MAG: hypothetical protein AAF577_01205 [Pseudomonadota bacterium]